MIIHLVQKTSVSELSYLFTVGNKTVCKANAPRLRGDYNFTITMADGRQQLLCHAPRASATLEGRNTYRIFKGKEQIGAMSTAVVSYGKPMDGYTYYRVEYEGEDYQLYEVSLGRQGTFICLWQDNRLVGISEKVPKAKKDNSIVYTMYFEELADFQLMIATVIYYDMASAPKTLEEKLLAKKNAVVGTRDEALLTKLDMGFIARIEALGEGLPTPSE